MSLPTLAPHRSASDYVLKPLVYELNALSTEGIEVNRGGSVEIIKGTLTAFLGDNLASHSCGFKQSIFFCVTFPYYLQSIYVITRSFIKENCS